MPLTLSLTMAALIAFAANSLLARAALGNGAMDAASFTAIRLISGAFALAALVVSQRGWAALRRPAGDWLSAAALFVYAVGFSLAYVRLSAATGALILFASVQATMILWAITHGNSPSPMELAGLGIAFAAFVYLVLPGLGTPDALGTLLMVLAGAAWGGYTLRGRGARNPLGTTAGNFIRAAPMCLLLLPLARGPVTPHGAGLALVSGIVASGLGYALWYRALPRLRTIQAATVQLLVPLIAALGAVLFLSETLTVRLVTAGSCILGGVALAILAKRPRPALDPKLSPPLRDRSRAVRAGIQSASCRNATSVRPK